MNIISMVLKNIAHDLAKFRDILKYFWDRPLLSITVIGIFGTFVFWIISNGGTGFTDKSSGVERTRSLWDWFDLLLVPLLLASGGVVLNLLVSRRADERANIDENISDDRIREQNLRSFINTIQDLILGGKREWVSDEKLNHMARAQAIATMTTLDARRLERVITFLADTGLIHYRPDRYAKSSSIENTEHGSGGSSSGDESGLPATGTEAGIASDRKLSIKFGEADFIDMSWQGANLKRVILDYAIFDGSNLRDAYMEQTSLRDASLRNVNFQSAYLMDADMTGAELDNVNFENAVLENCLLRGATVEGANFKNADLSGADFSGSIELTPEQLNSAASLLDVTLPDGQKIPDHPADENPPDYTVSKTEITTDGKTVDIWSFELRRGRFSRSR